MSTGTGEREAEVRAKVHSLILGGVAAVCRPGIHGATCDRLTTAFLSTDAELRRVEGERDEANRRALVEVDSTNRACAEWASVNATLTRERDEAREHETGWRNMCAAHERTIDRTQRERDEAREALAVVREQNAKMRSLLNGAHCSFAVTGAAPIRAWYADRDEALAAARPDVAPATPERTP